MVNDDQCLTGVCHPLCDASQQDIFNRVDMTQNGYLSLGELRTAMIATGMS